LTSVTLTSGALQEPTGREQLPAEPPVVDAVVLVAVEAELAPPPLVAVFVAVLVLVAVLVAVLVFVTLLVEVAPPAPLVPAPLVDVAELVVVVAVALALMPPVLVTPPWQAPATQAPPPAHAMPQPPQFEASDVVSMHPARH
jgi:hypothetical protein